MDVTAKMRRSETIRGGGECESHHFKCEIPREPREFSADKLEFEADLRDFT